MILQGAQSAKRLPELRQELQLMSPTVDGAGNQVWRIYDPVRHRFTAVGRLEHVMLEVWQVSDTADDVVGAAWSRHGELISPEEVQRFATFLETSALAISREPGAWRGQFEAGENRRSAYLHRLLHSYLFFRIPLVNPESFLRRSLPHVRFLGSRSTLAVLAVLLVLDLYMISREWEQFLATAATLATWSGAAGLVVAIAAAKLLHELGHGYVATRYGCRVPALGVAFILGVPLLYVDVTDAWRLKSRRARLAIDAAGIAVDLGVAVVAAFVWVMAPQGVLRDAAFFLATAGVLSSLAFNLNPFMKFDGYHMLADGLAMPNLQERAIELARWRLREILFGLGAPPPEELPRHLMRGLVWFGWGVWVYRLLLFTAIAVAVYHYFFKVLGIILFAVEIGYFIVRPIVNEIRHWLRMRKTIVASRRTVFTACLLVAGTLLALAPWSTEVRVPAVLEPANVASVHTPQPARLARISVATGQVVTEGAELMRLESSELQQRLHVARLKASIIDLRLSRLAVEAGDREQARVLEQERRVIAETIAGIRKEMSALTITAPIDGTVTSVAEYTQVGRWTTPSEPLALIYGKVASRVRGLVEGQDKDRIRPGMDARFIPHDIQLPSLPVRVARIATVNADSVDQLELAQSFGGAVPTRIGPSRAALPLTSVYAVTADLEQPDAARLGGYEVNQPQVGVLVVYGDAQSLIARLVNRILLVLVRESGF